MVILRVCASCEWIFKNHSNCPKCGFGSYGARYVYGNKCYRYAETQKPWMDKKIEKYTMELLDEIYIGGNGMEEHGRFIVNIPGDDIGVPFEFFCNGCGQLRLSFLHDSKNCGNCGSDNIIIGKPNELDKEALKKKYKESM